LTHKQSRISAAFSFFYLFFAFGTLIGHGTVRRERYLSDGIVRKEEVVVCRA
jgi:hypothetical protein